MKLYLKNWHRLLREELPRTHTLRIVSPFVSEQSLRTLQSLFDFKNFELITRFNMRDFAVGVSSLDGLFSAVEGGAKVYGISGLHSKVYIFDDRAAIITSANLTPGGLQFNYECGLFVTDKDTLKEVLAYFESLKQIGGDPLTLDMCEKWRNDLPSKIIQNARSSSLPDYGGTEAIVDKSKSYYIKFFGTSHGRKELTFTVKEEIDRALCHYACGFSENKKPRQIKDGDIIYMARLTTHPNDYAIFGKAEAIRYVDDRDRATKNEIAQRDWKKQWPIYLRVRNPVFIDGTLGDCIFLGDLIKALDYNSFPSTFKRYKKGEKSINPKMSLAQRASIELTKDAVDWLEPRFQSALNSPGKVPEQYWRSLPQSDTDISSWKKPRRRTR